MARRRPRRPALMLLLALGACDGEKEICRIAPPENGKVDEWVKARDAAGCSTSPREAT